MMKLPILLISIFSLFFWNGNQNPGPHGGIIKSADKYFIEMKNIPDTIFRSYLLDRKMNAISNKIISGEVELFYPDSTVLNMDLLPAENDAFVAKPLIGFYRCKITFHLSEKEVSANFDMRTQFVHTE